MAADQARERPRTVKDLRFFGEGEVTRDASGRLRFRAKRGTVGVQDSRRFEEWTRTSTSFAELPETHELTEEKAWELFDAEARRELGMSGEEFLRRWDSGEWPAPDGEAGVMSVAFLLPLIGRSMRRG